MSITRRLTIAGWSLIVCALVILVGASGWLRWTNVVAERRVDDERQNLISTWTAPSPAPSPTTVTVTEGESFALLSIPRLREKVWEMPILHGVGDDELRSGVGHYPTSALPGSSGNFALAGHRTAHGEPFSAFDMLQVGDEIIIRTPGVIHVYTLVRDLIVDPTEVWVVTEDATSRVVGSATGSIITLVTCTPKWSTRHRWVWWGVLSRTVEPEMMRS
jgi:sortase A